MRWTTDSVFWWRKSVTNNIFLYSFCSLFDTAYHKIRWREEKKKKKVFQTQLSSLSFFGFERSSGFSCSVRFSGDEKYSEEVVSGSISSIVALWAFSSLFAALLVSSRSCWSAVEFELEEVIWLKFAYQEEFEGFEDFEDLQLRLWRQADLRGWEFRKRFQLELNSIKKNEIFGLTLAIQMTNKL